MVDKGENILVEFDYDNITLIDPNKIVDSEGKVSDRLVKHENLVFYANLECNVLPRTKLALGSALNDSVRTVSVGKINFLNPGNKTFMDNRYTDEITGKGSLQGQGVNQPKLNSVQNPNKSDDFYLTQSTYSNGTPGAVDNGLLGITDIQVAIDTSFLPTVTVNLTDVKGRALFEGGNNSPYSAFFQLPYPMFYLTLKGYYGKAVRLPLMLQSFTSNFDNQTGNFKIVLKFFGYKYTVMSYVNWGAMMAVPHMYNNFVSTAQASTNTPAGSNLDKMSAKQVSRGYQKMKELYSEYKSKGLIDDDFPEITITQLKARLDRFINNILEKFTKENLGSITELDNFQTQLTEFQKKVFFYGDSWFETYMDKTTSYSLKDTKEVVYTYKKDYSDPNKQAEAETKLAGIFTEYQKLLQSNSVAGKNGSYTVGGKITKSEVPINATVEKCYAKINPLTDIDFAKTYEERNGKPAKTQIELDTFIATNSIVPGTKFFVFEGTDHFIDITEKTAKESSKLRREIEEKITDNLNEQLSNKDTGVGFKPSIRNILAVFFAQGEAFIRLMDDVHSKAWDLRENKYRRQAIFGSNSSALSVDVKSSTQNNEPIYPWPQVIKETLGDDKQEKFEIVYPGDKSISTMTKAYIPEIWPEVEFVEEFIKGYTDRVPKNPDYGDESNVVTRPNRLSLNALDFPVTNEVFQNKEEIKFFYEIYERIMVNTYYSKLNRQSGYGASIFMVEAEDEKINILKSLGNDNPFLTQKLKRYLIDQNNFLTFLRHISNQGEGESWQKFIRGEFTINYLKNKTNVPFELFNQQILTNERSQPNVSLTDESKIIDYIGNQTSSNEFDFSDMYPITNFNWCQNYLADGKALQNVNLAYNTKDVLSYNTTHKTICNFNNDDTNDKKRPITNFNYKADVFSQNIDTSNFKTFYNTRKIEEQFTTEGNLNYTNYDGFVTDTQTTSILNTPYFINAIQNGVYNFRYKPNDLSSYKQAAYLFLNSLPLASLREKYRSYNEPNDLSYILSTIKKFGAVHKLPYAWVVKYGSIWHRYKTWNDTGVDILDEVWKDFDYLGNYDPVTSASTKVYSLNIEGLQNNIVLENTVSATPNLVAYNSTTMNTGFFPKLYDDMNVFLQGLQLFSGATQLNGTCSIVGTTLDVYTINDNNLAPGEILAGPTVDVNTTIVSQINGTTGGVGKYVVDISQNTSILNGTCNVNGTTMDVLTFTGGTLSTGQIISGPTLALGTKIVSQVSGTTGGVGQYIIDITQTLTGENFTVVTPNIFYITNSTTGGYSQTEIQTLINDGKMVMTTNSSGKIIEISGFDPNDNDRSLKITPWSTIVKTTEGDKYFIMPSFGYTKNQTKDECFKNNKMKVEVSSNPAVFNGSVRLFWGSPNYGYFDNTKITKPNPDSYLKEILTDKKIQQNFSLNGDITKYNKISEMFTTFDTEILDYFEQEFLNFSRSIYDFKTLVPSDKDVETESERSYKNFQLLMRELLVVEKPSTLNSEGMINSVIEKQKTNFQGILTNFLEYNVILKMGNPSMFDRRTFLTFSTKFLIDPVSYQGYNQGTTGSLPSNGGTVTLAQSKTANPETWKTLEKYVGFSEIPELVYSDNGSYITDFFIDLNVQFTEKNVKDFAPLIMLYATQKLNNFEVPTNNVVIPNPVPTPAPSPQTPGDLLTTVTLKDTKTISVYKFGPQKYGVYKDASGTILFTGQPVSASLYPLNTPIVNAIIISQYTTGLSSTPNDPQFIISTVNVTTSQVTTTTTTLPIVQNLGNSLGGVKFYGLMDEYLDKSETYLKNVISNLMTGVRAGLPNITIEGDKGNKSQLEGEQTRVEMWETFKAFNDTWVAGGDFKSKTMFEDVLLFDRASRDVGQKVYVDIFKIKDLIETELYQNNMLDIVSTILSQNNFTYFPLPAYANFYNAQDAEKNPVPRSEGSTEFANSFWGTFLNVDYRNTSPKFLCYYANKPSQYVDMKDNVDYRFRDDAFDLRRASDNPLVESQSNKKNWDKSNKVVGFNIDISNQNQQIFKNFSVGQDVGKPTAESLEMLNQMANQSRNRSTGSQNVSLYNLYRNRSYECSVDMMGNALIQPMMYFNVRNIPMFSGPYMITSVTHQISEGEFSTTFKGTRQPFYSLPKIDSFIQSLSLDIISKLQEKVKANEEKAKSSPENVIFQKNNVVSNVTGTDTITKNQDCSDKINSGYVGYTPLDNPISTQISYKDFIKLLEDRIVAIGIPKETTSGVVTTLNENFLKLSAVLFSFIYLDSASSSGMKAYENNYSTINLTETYGPILAATTNKKYYCLSRGTNLNIPVVSFISAEKFVDFAIGKFKDRLSLIETATDEEIVQLYVTKYPNIQPDNVYTEMTEQDKNTLQNKVKQSVDIYRSLN